MISRTTGQFRLLLAQLPAEIQAAAREAYRLFSDNPSHPSLRFKPVQGTRDVYSARVSYGYRALGLVDGNTVVWFWIGSHADYDKLLRHR